MSLNLEAIKILSDSKWIGYARATDMYACAH